MGHTLFDVFSGAGVSAQALVALSIFLGVFAPIFYRHRVTSRSALFAALLVCLFPACAYNLPAVFGVIFQHMIDPILGDCKRTASLDIYLRVYSWFFYYTPIVVAFCAYVLVWLKVRKGGEHLRRAARGSLASCMVIVLLALLIFPWRVLRSFRFHHRYPAVAVVVKYFWRASFAIKPVGLFVKGRGLLVRQNISIIVHRKCRRKDGRSTQSGIFLPYLLLSGI